MSGSSKIRINNVNEIDGIISNKTCGIVGLYIGQNPDFLIFIKVGRSNCLQNRVWDSAYMTACWHPWKFEFFIRKDQESSPNDKMEKTLHKYMRTHEKLNQSSHGRETFRSKKDKSLELENIATRVEKFLDDNYIRYSKQIPKEFRISTSRNLYTYTGPHFADKSFTCFRCSKHMKRKSFFIVNVDGTEEKVGFDCMEHYRNEGYQNANKAGQFYEKLEGFTEHAVRDICIVSYDETCLRYIAFRMTSQLNIDKYKFSCNDTLDELYHKSLVLCLAYCYDKSIISNISVSSIVEHYNEMPFISKDVVNYIINSGLQTSFKFDEKGKLTCLILQHYLDGLKDVFRTIKNERAELDFELSDLELDGEKKDANQNDAVKKFCEGSVDCIFGGAGSGKTHCIIKIFKRCYEKQIPCYITSTGALVVADCQSKCAEKICNKIDSKYFSNISKLICGPQIGKNCVLIIDEGPFTDPIKLYFLLKKFSKPPRVLFVGDMNQIKPINFPDYWISFFNDVKAEIVILRKPYRQDDVLSRFSESYKVFKYPENEVLKMSRVSIVQSEIMSHITSINSENIKIESEISHYIENISCNKQNVQFLAIENKQCDDINDRIYHRIATDHKCKKEWTDSKNRDFCRKCVEHYQFILTKNIKTKELENIGQEIRDQIKDFGMFNGRLLVMKYRNDELIIKHPENDLNENDSDEKGCKYANIRLGLSKTPDSENFSFTARLLKKCNLRYALTPEKFQGKEANEIVVFWHWRLSHDPHKLYSIFTRPRKSLILIADLDFDLEHTKFRVIRAYNMLGKTFKDAAEDIRFVNWAAKNDWGELTKFNKWLVKRSNAQQ